MGGSSGIYDYEENQWLKDEKAFIQTGKRWGNSVLGSASEPELLADVLGARVYENGTGNGWFPVKAAAGNKTEFIKGLPEEITVFHWHGPDL
jgi:GMP synthase-like glutamine amidotransferase